MLSASRAAASLDGVHGWVSFGRRVKAGSAGARSARTWERCSGTRVVSEQVQLSLVDAHADRTSLVPGAAPTAPPLSSASVKSHLRMWSSTRLLWPPSRSLRSDWSAGWEGVPTRECSGSGGAQHAGPQHGSGRSCGCRCSTEVVADGLPLW